MNAVFSNNDFWNLFWNLEPDDIGDFNLEKNIEILSQDFDIKKEINGSLTYYSVNLSFNCGQKYSLLLDCGFHNGFGLSCDKSLQLKDNLTKETYELGWWDMARWHPYCLRPEELRFLIEYWKRFDSKWQDGKLPLLLLLHFVGFENETQAEPFFEEATEICKVWEIHSRYLQIENWFEAIEREKYKWSFNQNLGWTIGNDDYSCYSLRNKEHYNDAINDEGSFPFRKFNQMMQEVYERLNS
jgi:hypothetical protein